MISKISHTSIFCYSVVRDIIRSEASQKILECATFALSFWGLYNISTGFEGRQVEKKEPVPNWKQQALRICNLLGNLSYVGNGIISQPGIYILKTFFTGRLGAAEIERICSSSHIYHFRIASYILGLPATLISAYRVSKWFFQLLAQKAETRDALQTADVVNVTSAAVATATLMSTTTISTPRRYANQ